MWLFGTKQDPLFGIPEYKCPKTELDFLKTKENQKFHKIQNGLIKKPPMRKINKSVRKNGHLDDILQANIVLPKPWKYEVLPKSEMGGKFVKTDMFIQNSSFFQKRKWTKGSDTLRMPRSQIKTDQSLVQKNLSSLFKKNQNKVVELQKTLSTPGPGHYFTDKSYLNRKVGTKTGRVKKNC